MSEGLADEKPGEVRVHLPDVSLAAQARRTARWMAVSRRLDAIRPADLSPDAREDYLVYRQQIAAFLDDQHFREWEKPVNGDSAFWSDRNMARTASSRGGWRITAPI